MPIQERLELSQTCVRSDRQALTAAVNRITEEGLTPVTYKVSDVNYVHLKTPI